MVKINKIKSMVAGVGLVATLATNAAAGVPTCEEYQSKTNASDMGADMAYQSGECTKNGFTFSKQKVQDELDKSKKGKKQSAKKVVNEPKETRAQRSARLCEANPNGVNSDNFKILDSSKKSKFEIDIAGTDWCVKGSQNDRVKEFYNQTGFKPGQIASINFNGKKYTKFETFLKQLSTKSNKRKGKQNVVFNLKETGEERVARLRKEESERTVVINELKSSTLPTGIKTEEEVLKSVEALSIPNNSKTRYAIVPSKHNGEPVIARINNSGKVLLSPVWKNEEGTRSRDRDGLVQIGKEGSYAFDLEEAKKSLINELLHPSIQEGTQSAYNLRQFVADNNDNIKGALEFLGIGNGLEKLLSDEKIIVEQNVAGKKYKSGGEKVEKVEISAEDRKAIFKERMDAKNTSPKKFVDGYTEIDGKKYSAMELIIAGSNLEAMYYSAEIIAKGQSFEAFYDEKSSEKILNVLGYIVPINTINGNSSGWTGLNESKTYTDLWKQNVLNNCLNLEGELKAIDYFNCGYTNNSEVLNAVKEAYKAPQIVVEEPKVEVAGEVK